MQLNIKNSEAYQMARELSLLTGENLTQAVFGPLNSAWSESVPATVKTAKVWGNN